MQGKWIGFAETEGMSDAISHISTGSPQYLVDQLRNLKLLKDSRSALLTKHDIQICQVVDKVRYLRQNLGSAEEAVSGRYLQLHVDRDIDVFTS